MAHRSDENNPIVNGAPIFRGGVSIGDGKALAESNRNRRTLGDISDNVVAARQVPRAMNKRGCPERNMVSENNPPVPRIHRPVTRRFAAALSTKQPQRLDAKISSSVDLNASESDSKPSELDDCIIIDAVEDAEVTDSKSPMSMKEAEVFDEIVEMEEDSVVELEIVMVQPPAELIRRDIDGHDVNDPLAVVEYIGDIYAFHKRIEKSSCVPPNYMDRQFDINGRMRAILMDWLIEVHYKFELLDETLFLMVNVIDRFLAQKSVERKKLQLVGVTGLLLACKYEEVQVPIVEDLVVITDKAYSRGGILEMERLMVNTLQFNMSVPTPYVFMRRFLKIVQANRRLELVSFYLVELSLVEYDMLRFPPSLLAAAAIFTAQCTIDRIRNWSATSQWHTTFSEADLMECSKMMVSFHQNAATGKLTGVHRKYMFKYGYGAVSEPALFLLRIRS